MPKRSAPLDNDQGQWETSSSSEEDWGNGEWEVLGIAEDHVDTRGNLRFKIEWGGWKRDDGSNSTWEVENGTTMQDLAALQKRWQHTQDTEFAREAGSPTVSPFSPSVCRDDEVGDVDENDVEEKKAKPKRSFRYTFTELTHQARQMAINLKDEEIFAQSPFLMDASVKLQAMRDARDSALQALDSTISNAPSLCLYELGPAPQKNVRYQAQKKAPLHRQMRTIRVSQVKSQKSTATARRKPEIQLPAKLGQQTQTSSSLFRTNKSFDFQLKPLDQPGFKLPTARMTRPLPQRLFTTPEVQKKNFEETITTGSKKRFKDLSGLSSMSSSSENLNIPAKPELLSPPSARDIIQAKWSSAAERAGAAPVTFVDTFDKNSAPVDDITTFTYLESEYIFSSAVPHPDPDFIESCDCMLGCTASLCSCQDDSVLQDEDEESKAFAYDNKGLFAFRANMRSYVIECNKNCLCDAKCYSRVAQRPRKFPIEIFRTERCGWGVRSSVALTKGSVIGVYTGKLIPRSRTSGYSSRQISYVFDLDFYLTQSGEYSVDAYNCGNWTRFINHSCNPTCILYPVVWDSVPAMHQPKLAFVAKADMLARAEISIDYNPKARKGKGKAKIMPGTPDCMCGSEECRGFIYDE